MLKSGFRTSEFWITVGIAAMSAFVVLDHTQPPNVKIAAVAAAVLKAALYTVQRTKLKADPPPGLMEPK